MAVTEARADMEVAIEMAAPPRDGKGRQASGSFDIHQMTHSQTQRENCILLSRAHGYMLPMTGPSVVDTLPPRVVCAPATF